MKYFFLLVILLSCAPLRDDKYMAGWIGLPIAELRTHPYFSTLPPRVIHRSAVKKTVEYREPKGYRTKVECETVGGCVGLQYLADCAYVFEIDTTIILSATLHGQCRKDERLKPQ